MVVSAENAGALGFYGYTRHTLVNDDIVVIPPQWKDGWQLVIANPNENPAAVSYMVWNA